MALAVQEKKFERIWSMKIYLATQPIPDKDQGNTLTNVKCCKRLMSYIYIYIVQDREFNLRKYIRTGKV